MEYIIMNGGRESGVGRDWNRRIQEEEKKREVREGIQRGTVNTKKH